MPRRSATPVPSMLKVVRGQEEVVPSSGPESDPSSTLDFESTCPSLALGDVTHGLAILLPREFALKPIAQADSLAVSRSLSIPTPSSSCNG